MKKILTISAAVILSTLLSSCAAVAGIFKAGVWVGVLIVVGVIALLIFLFTRGSGK